MSDDARLTELEIKVAYLEKLVDDLNEVILEQTARIDRLVGDLRDRAPQGGDVGEPEKPPHY